MTTTQQTILVGFDGSEDATSALDWALASAGHLAARVEVVVVLAESSHISPPLREYEAGIAERSAALAAELIARKPGIEATVAVERGWPVPVLLDRARKDSLVVVGSRGHGLVESHWLGSVSQHLAGHAPCSVAVIRPAHNSRATTILVGIDGSEASERALRFACERARLTGENILAVHAYQYGPLSSPGLAILPEDIDTAVEDAAQTVTDEFVACVAPDFPDVQVRGVAVVGRAARVLARLSDDASLVVVGSRGRSALAEIVLGSVAQGTLARAECPVVVVR